MQATPSPREVEVMTRAEFLLCFAGLARQFEARAAQASSAEGRFFESLARCSEVARAHPLAGSQLEKDNDLARLVDGHAQRIRLVFGEWQRTVRNRETHAEFKKRTADSLLVFVYGKVKAGKSSLGNYIAWGAHDPAADLQLHGDAPPRFFMETSRGLTENISDGEIRRRQKFTVGSTETTSAIQGFTLPGLTWVDSPGLHSKNEENGRLAQQYVDAADLVLYLTSSAAPCKRSDVMELKELGRKEHTLAVLITGSDMFEEDEDDEGHLVKVRTMKPAADRASQVAYTRRTLAEQGLDEDTPAADIMGSTLRRAQVFSVSVAYAEEHPDARGMADSGIGHMLCAVARLAEGEGVRAKLVQPLKNLRGFLHEVSGRDLPELRQRLDACRESVENARSDARRRALVECQAIAVGIGQEVDELVRRHAMDDAAFRRALGRAYKRWIQNGMREAAQAYESTMETGLPEALDAVVDAIPGFETRTLKTTRRRNIRANQGAALGALLLGGVATLLTGGLAALALGVGGSMLGGLAGRRVGGLLDGEESLHIPVGDNALEVGSAARARLRKEFDARMNEVVEGLDRLCFEGLSQWIQRLQEQCLEVEVLTSDLLEDLEVRIARDAPHR